MNVSNCIKKISVNHNHFMENKYRKGTTKIENLTVNKIGI